jgi:hypothetical protein
MKKVEGISVTTEIEEKKDEIPRVRVYIPKNEDDESGLKVDPYEHVTINGETTLVRRGEYVDVSVPVFMQLRNKFPNI